MTKGDLLKALEPFDNDILLVTRLESDGSYSERTFSKFEYHWEGENARARGVLIIKPGVIGLNT